MSLPGLVPQPSTLSCAHSLYSQLTWLDTEDPQRVDPCDARSPYPESPLRTEHYLAPREIEEDICLM